jgi:hypothetical protein
MDDSPQGSANWFSYVLGLLVGLIAWVGEVYRRRVDSHQQLLSNFVNRKELEAWEQKVANLITRAEFLAHMRQLSDETDRRNVQTREEHMRMHEQNVSNNLALREDIRSVHSRIDELFTNANKKTR